jgi:HSP20 family protein
MVTSRFELAPTLWNQVQQFQNEMNRLFDRWGHNREWSSLGAFPPINVWEEGDKVLVEAELPGLDLKDLETFVTGGRQLTIKGERKPPQVDKGVWHRQERTYGSFIRSLSLPFPVDPEHVDARFEHGVLKITLAKHESAKPRKIAVKADTNAGSVPRPA